MGYTHYWSHHYIQPGAWSVLMEDASKVIAEVEAKGIPLAGRMGYNRPIVTEGVIGFNGVGQDGAESFALHPDFIGFDFCKTERQPYDVAVTTILLRATLSIPGFAIKSDGTYGDLEEWIPAQYLHERLFGAVPTVSPFALQIG